MNNIQTHFSQLPLVSVQRLYRLFGLVGLLLLSSPAIADIQSQAFSGINHFVPTHARMSLYKYKAELNRTASDGIELSQSLNATNKQLEAIGNCSLSIGNLFTDDSSIDDFSEPEINVFIDGDVINASNCD